MNAKDLMLNDWVQDETGTIIGQVLKLDIFSARIEFAYHTIDANYVYPIPLTEEILEKNFPEYEPGYEIGWWPTEDGKYHIELSRDKMVVDMECGVDYVHELQHLLKLCKIDKEIVL